MLKNSFDFKSTEEKLKKFWEREKIYKFNPKKKKIFSIDTPPPTVSGKMHIGHAFSYSQQDFIARFKRMFLSNEGTVYYPFGTDDNGLPTEKLVEKINDIKSKEMPRQKFIDLCLKTLEKITPDFIQDWKDIGLSCDFEQIYSTIDKNVQKISQKSFIELFKKGEVYKKNFPTIWCPECQTSIAQAELEDKEIPSIFLTLKFLVDNDELFIATTRPELLAACVAVFVNPKDNKYQKFIGKKAKVPLFGYEVPIIADESANIEKGTGALMICSYGDKYDVDAVNRYSLEPRVIFNKKGSINWDMIEKDVEGLLKISFLDHSVKINDFRKIIIGLLRERALIKEEKSISHVVNVHDKCGTPIEFIPTEQWFIKILDKKDTLIKQGNKIKWYPESMRKRYNNWIEGLDWDWNISRERHFGVPIPVWECENCKNVILPEEKELPIDPLQSKKNCPKCKNLAKPEDKVLDTWATSSLTPQIIENLSKGKIKIPLSLRTQAHEIIRTWAFYTIVKSYLHEGKIPWENIMISGFVTLQGEKMSKSKGNVVNPKDILEKYGADALRFWAAGSKLGNDFDYQEKDLITGIKFINKLRNAANFVFINLKHYNGQKPKKLESLDDLFLNELNNLIKNCTENFKIYEYSKVKLDLEMFFWHDFCDNYLEIVKRRIYQGTMNKKLSAQYTLYFSLLTILKLIAPIMPFITEEIYHKYFKKNEKEKSIHLSKWPKENRKKNSNKDWSILKELIFRIRKEKSKAQKSMNAEIILTLEKKIIKKLKNILEDLKNVTNAKEIKEGEEFKVEFL